jgi:serine/threonine-protein kinase
MGEVWRAEDTRLGRQVALKVLPAEFARDPDRMARFEREAKVLASLNHPNIATLYGLETVDSGTGTGTGAATGREGDPASSIEHPASREAAVHFLVMELVEGEGLDELVARGPVPLEEAIPIALQIAEALEAAHEAGIVHRDLKPANIKIRPDGTVKVLDFGLAKAWDSKAEQVDLAHSPTLTRHATAAGVILGTAAYMSPEQARGKPVDRRSDIWSFGVVLWEMLTGQKIFDGDTVTDVLAAVLTRDLDIEVLPPTTPPAVRRVLRRALERDPNRRLQCAGDARLELMAPDAEAIDGRGPVATGGGRLGLVVGAFGLIAAAVTAGWAVLQRPEPALDRPLHVDISDAGFKAFSNAAISPDGRWIAYALNDDDTNLQLRSLDGFEVREVPETANLENPFFSTDSKWVAYFDPVGDAIGKVSLSGGHPTRLPGSHVAGAFRTGVWHPNGSLIVSSAVVDGKATSGLSTIPESGGEGLELTVPQGDQVYHYEPCLVPGSDWILYTAETQLDYEVWAVSLATRETKLVVKGAATPQVLASGHLLVFRFNQQDVVAYRFDEQRAEVDGEPTVVLQDVGTGPRNGGRYAVTDHGTLIYTALDNSSMLATGRSVVWVDRQGNVEQIVDEHSSWAQPRLSPDGRTLLLRKVVTPDCSLWTYDLERRTLTRISFEEDAHDPLWSSSGDAVLYTGGFDPVRTLVEIPADGTGRPETLASAAVSLRAASWSKDGQLLALGARTTLSDDDIWVLDNREGAEPQPFLDSRFAERFPAFSPDGRWLAYASNESGSWEVYVRPYPGPGGRVQVSSDGGLEPLWSGDGSELFFRTSWKMMAVSVVRADDGLVFGRPRALFDDPYLRPSKISPDVQSYDVTPDGARFVMIERNDLGTANADLRVVIGWSRRLGLE